MLKLIFTSLALLISASSFALADTASVCTPVTIKTQNNNLMLPGVDKTHTEQVYLIKNLSKQSVWLDHPQEKQGASAGWSSYLRAGDTSALLLNRKNFAISCATINPGNLTYLDCGKILSACASNPITTTSSRGTYWMVEDKSWDEVVKIVTKHEATPKK